MVADLSATDLSLATFAPLLGSTFRVRASEAADAGETGLDVELIGAERLGESDRSFTLQFRGGPGAFLPQGTFVFAHPRLGAFELFVSPTARTASGFTTEAIFNRLPEPPEERPR
jgi:hypothetical protein